MEDAENKERSRTKKHRIKAVVWLAVILVVALGFAHQYFIHTDRYIKSYIEKNKTELYSAAEVMLKRPTEADEFKNLLSAPYTDSGKFHIETLIDNPYYEDYRDILKKADKAGIQDIKSDGETVRFYHSSRFIVIYSPEKDEITGAEPAGDGWFYIRSF